MKTIGLIGGMSWESTAQYYRRLNQEIKTTLGGLHSAKVIINSLDFAEIEILQTQDRWQEATDILSDAAKKLEAAGADFLLIGTNTMHKVADTIEKHINIPLIHIGDATGEKLQSDKIKRVGLLGTRFTMEEDFYKTRLSQKFDLDVIIPTEKQRNTVHRIIYEELCLGKVNVNSRAQYLQIIDDLQQQGAEAIILGCTEISLLIQTHHTSCQLYDTTEIHIKKAIQLALVLPK